MKHLRRTLLASLMLLALSAPAFAGEGLIPPAAGPQESPGRDGEVIVPPAAAEGEIPTPPAVMGDILFPGLSVFGALFL